MSCKRCKKSNGHLKATHRQQSQPQDDKHPLPVDQKCQQEEYFLLPWEIDDYSIADGFKDRIDFGRRTTIYNSQLALKGEVFADIPWKPDYPPKYQLRNYRITFPPGTGIPGAFDYSQGFNLWGGDDSRGKYGAGYNKYSTIINGFGHPHILTAQAAIELRKYCGAVDMAHEMLLTRLALGSEKIFRWCAGLDNPNGDPIPYDKNTPAGYLRNILDRLISSNDPIDLNEIYGDLNMFNKVFFGSNKVLTDIVNRTKQFNDSLLQGGQIEFMPWHSAMIHHQQCIFDAYDCYEKYYQARDKGDKEAFRQAKKELNIEVRKLINSGPQLGAFFILFNGATVYLNYALDISGASSESLIPSKYIIDRVNYFGSLSTSYWKQHTVMFNDFVRVIADDCFPNRVDEMYKIKVSMLESCEIIGIVTPEAMYVMDGLVRYRSLYDVLPKSFPSS